MKLTYRIAAAGLSAVSLAYAQTSTPIYIQLGGQWPGSSATRSNSSNFGWAAGVGYVVFGASLGSKAGTEGSIDFLYNATGGGLPYQTYDLGYRQTWSFGGGKGGALYIGAGAGVRIASVNTVSTTTGSSGGSTASQSSQSETTGYLEGIFGYKLDSHLSIELDGRFAEKTQDVNTDAVSLLLGYRF